MKTIITGVLLLSIQMVAIANSIGEQWHEANKLYNNQQYDSATIIYEQLIKSGNKTSAIYYNLANSYYRLNDIGNAILNYERSLLIDPKNTLAKENIELTKSRIPNRIQPIQKIFFLQWWQNLTDGTTATFWAISALAIFLLIVASYILHLTNHITLNIPKQLIGSIITLWAFLLVFAFIATNNRTTRNFAVVMINDSPFMQKPNNSVATSLIPEGTTVKMLNSKSSWSQIILPDGRKGWIQTELIEKI